MGISTPGESGSADASLPSFALASIGDVYGHTIGGVNVVLCDIARRQRRVDNSNEVIFENHLVLRFLFDRDRAGRYAPTRLRPDQGKRSEQEAKNNWIRDVGFPHRNLEIEPQLALKTAPPGLVSDKVSEVIVVYVQFRRRRSRVVQNIRSVDPNL